MFPWVTQRLSQDLGNSSNKGDDTSQNCQEAYGEATWVEGTEQSSSCQNDHCYDIGNAQPECDTFELQAPRSSFPQRHPSVAWDWSAIQQLADGDQGNPTMIIPN